MSLRLLKNGLVSGGIRQYIVGCGRTQYLHRESLYCILYNTVIHYTHTRFENLSFYEIMENYESRTTFPELSLNMTAEVNASLNNYLAEEMVVRRFNAPEFFEKGNWTFKQRIMGGRNGLEYSILSLRNAH